MGVSEAICRRLSLVVLNISERFDASPEEFRYGCTRVAIYAAPYGSAPNSLDGFYILRCFVASLHIFYYSTKYAQVCQFSWPAGSKGYRYVSPFVRGEKYLRCFSPLHSLRQTFAYFCFAKSRRFKSLRQARKNLSRWTGFFLVERNDRLSNYS